MFFGFWGDLYSRLRTGDLPQDSFGGTTDSTPFCDLTPPYPWMDWVRSNSESNVFKNELDSIEILHQYGDCLR